MSTELKIKTKHLGEEARIIRFEEQKLKTQAAWLRAKFGPDTRTPVEGKSWYNWPLTPLGMVEYKLNSISQHRKWDVRNENRAAFLARAFLKGQPYRKVETKTTEASEVILFQHVLPRIVKMVQKYGTKEQAKTTRADIVAWLRTEA